MINNEYQKVYSSIENSVSQITPISNSDILNTPFVDKFTTSQQKARDKEITRLLRLYVNAYEHKTKSNKWYKRILFILSIAIIAAFAIALLWFVTHFISFRKYVSIESVVQVISVCITFLTLIFGIMEIITRHVFPANDEEYITRIVELIQTNDLDNKKENIKIESENSTSKKLDSDGNIDNPSNSIE